jgi:hypothetical protein
MLIYVNLRAFTLNYDFNVSFPCFLHSCARDPGPGPGPKAADVSARAEKGAKSPPPAPPPAPLVPSAGRLLKRSGGRLLADAAPLALPSSAATSFPFSTAKHGGTEPAPPSGQPTEWEPSPRPSAGSQQNGSRARAPQRAANRMGAEPAPLSGPPT